MDPNGRSFPGPSIATAWLLPATSEREIFKRLDDFLDTMLFTYREAPFTFRESLALRLRERVITTLGEADYDNTLRKSVLKKERLRSVGEQYKGGDLDDKLNDNPGAVTDEEGGSEDMDAKRDREEDDGLPSYSIEDTASEHGDRVSTQQNDAPTALSQASVIIGVDGGKIMIAREDTSSPYDPSTIGFSRLCLSRKRKRSASTLSNFSLTVEDGMHVDTGEDSPFDNLNSVKMGIPSEQSTGGRSPARKKSKN